MTPQSVIIKKLVNCFNKNFTFGNFSAEAVLVKYVVDEEASPKNLQITA